MNIKELRDEYLRYSKRMLEAASDPSSPGVDFAHQCRIAQLAAMVAYLVDALANYTASSIADSVANELGELASAGEPLADWVDERLAESTPASVGEPVEWFEQPAHLPPIGGIRASDLTDPSGSGS